MSVALGVPVQKRLARVKSVESLGPSLARVDLEGEGIGLGVAPGRFAMVEAPGRWDCILLRPYSYFVAPTPDSIGLLVKVVGKGTRSLCECAPQVSVRVLGPLGNTFPEPVGRVWAVAGGVGAAPFGEMVQHDGVRVLFGSRTASEIGFARALEAVGARVALATDDGSAGWRGTVVDLLERELSAHKPPSAIFTCGPTIMMSAVAALARRQRIPCWASLEERMGCGIAVCRGCAHADAQGGWRCICEDGPVYATETIFAPERD